MRKAPLEKISILISFKDKFESRGELVRILAPRTFEALAESLPFTSHTFVWKEEIYFDAPIKVGPEKAKADVQPGDIAYWPPGKAFCIFYGNSQPYSNVNVIGKITSDLEPLRKIKQGEWVTVRLLQ
jgi:hypothetical protein